MGSLHQALTLLPNVHGTDGVEEKAQSPLGKRLGGCSCKRILPLSQRKGPSEERNPGEGAVDSGFPTKGLSQGKTHQAGLT